MNARLSRRSILRGAAGALIPLPLLEAMGCNRIEEPAAGSQRSALEPGASPQRFVVFFTANGCIYDRWKPFGQGSDFTFIDAKNPNQLRELTPLESYKDQLLVLQNLGNPSRANDKANNAHDKGMGHLLTCNMLVPGPHGAGEFAHLSDGSVSGPSIDQVVASRLMANTRLRSLELGVQSRLDPVRQITTRMCYQGKFQVLPPENDPREVFKVLFGSGGTNDAAQLAARLEQRRSVLDKVSADLNRLLPKVSTRDRAKLDSHLTAIRDVELALSGSSGSAKACASPTAPSATLDPLKDQNFPAVGKAQMDLLALALACDSTRVATLQWSVGQSPTAHTWLGIAEAHHTLSHEVDSSAASKEKIVKIDNWYAQQFAYLLGKLKAQEEAGGSVLDNSIVLWCNEQGNGQTHSFDKIPHVLAGSGGGKFRTGRTIDCTGRANGDLYVSILNAMGATDVQSFGLPEACKGPLPGLV